MVDLHQDWINQVYMTLTREISWAEQRIAPCSEREIEEMIQSQKVARLPSVYRELMLKMGRDSIIFERKHYFAYPYVLSFKENAIGFLEFWRGIKPNTFSLPNDAFIFFVAEQSTYYYFHTETLDENPPIYFFWEDDEVFHKKVYDRLTDLILDNTNLFVNLYKERQAKVLGFVPPVD